MSNVVNLNRAQSQQSYELQRALRQLPIEVVLNHIKIAMKERGDFELEHARALEKLAVDLVWEFL